MLAQLLPSVFYSTVLSYFISDGGTTKFHHYTSMNDEYNLKLNPGIREDRSSFFDQLNSTYPTVMYMHGFLGNTTLGKQFCHATDKGYEGNVNCIIVDWTMTSHHANYLQVKKDLAQVAGTVALFMYDLEKYGHKVENFVLVGHSLGAHLCGLSARRLDKSLGKVGIIIGLDPAGPGFSYDDFQNRLDRSDADYVLVLHTDTRAYGMEEAIGDADIYVNGGSRQPGCTSLPLVERYSPCSHLRAETLWVEAMSNNFHAVRCSLHQGWLKKYLILKDDTEIIMGPDMTRARGVFYLETEREPPFVKPFYWYRNRPGAEVKIH